MTKNQPELKACPFPEIFKDGKVHITHEGQGDIWRVSCSSCGTRGPIAKTKDEAVRLWNARPSPIIPEDAVTREDTACDKSQLLSSSTSLEPAADDALQEAVRSLRDANGYASIADYGADIETLINHVIKGQGK